MKPHGTASRYKNGCRCDACRTAQNAAQKEWIKRTGQGGVGTYRAASSAKHHDDAIDTLLEVLAGP